jgi:hypothetical protein
MRSSDELVKALLTDLIVRGFHAVIVEGPKHVTVRPLTARGHQAICAMLAGAPDHVLQRLRRKKSGYYSGVQVQGTPEQIAGALVRNHGLPVGSVAMYRAP